MFLNFLIFIKFLIAVTARNLVEVVVEAEAVAVEVAHHLKKA